jgi:hypothetical protein
LPRVFVNYRRQDTAGHAGRLYDRLTKEFGEKNVFIDVDAIDVGSDFVDRINESVTSCDAVVAVIGDEWLEHGATGNRRIDNPADFVRAEIRSALEAGVSIIPVLVSGAEMPGADDLPEDIRPLARRNGLVVDDGRWNHDVGKLVAAIRRIEAERRRQGSPRSRRGASTANREPRAARQVRSFGRREGLLIAAAGVAAVVVGIAVAGMTGPSEVAAAEVSGGGVTLSVDSDWREVPSGQISGLELRDPAAALIYEPLTNAQLVAGTVADPGDAFDPLPDSLRHQIRGPARPEPVRLGKSTEAMAYDGRLKGQNGASVRVFMVPTASGFEAIGCSASAAEQSAYRPACDAVAASADVDGAMPLASGPSRAYADSMDQVLTELSALREAQGASLRRANRPGAQAKAALAISDAHAKAAQEIGNIDNDQLEGSATKAVQQAVASLQQGFADLARAARAADDAAYEEARADIREADEGLLDAVDHLNDLGGEK